MTWTIEKDEFLELCTVLDLVQPRPGIHSSEFFRIMGKGSVVRFSIASEVTGNVKIAGQGQWPLQDVFYLDRRIFLPFIFAAKDTESDAPFQFKRKENELVVRQGNRKASFASQSKVDGYGKPPNAEIVSKLELGDGLRNLIYCAREIAADDPTTPQLNCVFIKPNSHRVNILATNQKVLFRGDGKLTKKIRQSIPFPLYLVRLLGSDKLKAVQWYKKYVALKFRHGQIWQAVSSKALKDFPVQSIEKFMQMTAASPAVLTISSKKLSEALNRLCVYLSAVRRQDWSLKLIGKKGTQELLVRSTMAGSAFNERIKLKKPLGADLALEWPLEMLEPIFQLLATSKDVALGVRVDKKGRSYVNAGSVELVIPRREK